MRLPYSLALVALGACTRSVRTSAPDTARPRSLTIDRPRTDAAFDRPSRAIDAEDGSTPSALEAEAARAGVAPLFARKVHCLSASDPRGFSRQRRQDGSYRGEPLTMPELVARPWLWGLYPSTCPAIFAVSDRDGGQLAPFDRGPLEARVLAVADRYLGFGHVDDAWRFAPFDCLMPPSGAPIASLDAAAPHDRKLYYLYARDRAAYLAHRDVPGQIVVKEAWAPDEVPMAEAISTSYPPQCARVRDGRCMQPGAFKGLFVMMRVSPSIESDDGWIYATVDPAGAITASGRIASCINCHQNAPHGRLFGVINEAQARWR
jgi:hypothetical protein